jgi:glyoxylase-like metal-dependent hydrolase (beta-lactamase superfamily II)
LSALIFPFREVGGGMPQPGTTFEVGPGVRWLRMPLPYQLNHINLWLLEDGEGWTLVDCGIALDDTKRLWEKLFAIHRIRSGHSRLLCTHFHPDHMGLAGWLSAKLDAELWTTRAEWLFGRMLYLDASGDGQKDIAQHYARNGLDEERARNVFTRGNTYRAVVSEPPRSFHRIRHGERVEIGGRSWEVIVGLGHAPEQACLYSADLRMLIAGDQILPKITPNVGVWATEPHADPLTDYLSSLERFRPLPPDTLVLPSHGFPFRGLHARIDQLQDHHEQRFARLRGAFNGTSKTAMELVPVLFPQELDIFQVGFALGETLAHLAAMETRGEIRRAGESDGKVRFAA